MLKSKFTELVALQSKRELYETKADRIQQVSPLFQPPPCFFVELDEAVKIGTQQAKIWNDIRGFILKDNKTTIWQFSIKNNFPVRYFGEEHFLKLTKEQLNLIQIEIK